MSLAELDFNDFYYRVIKDEVQSHPNFVRFCHPEYGSRNFGKFLRFVCECPLYAGENSVNGYLVTT